MSNFFEVNPPTNGMVTLQLSWTDAEILTRLVGMANTGNLDKHSPALVEFVTEMVGHVGRNNFSEADHYIARAVNGQVYIEPIEEVGESDGTIFPPS